MEIMKAINSRRSIRKFRNKKIPKNILLNILESGNNAPSACNLQAWRFIVITSNKIKQLIVDNGAASFILNAPIGILVIYNNQSDNLEYNDYIQSASACIQNMLLTAHSLGIGSCWVCHLPLKRQIRRIIRIPDFYDPIAYIALGYPLTKPKIVKRKNKLDKLISYNFYNFKEKKPIKLKTKVKRFSRKVYYMIPYRRYIKPFIDKIFEKKFDN